MPDDGPVFTFREEDRDDVHAYVGVFVGSSVAGRLCFRRDEWAALREILRPCAVEVVEREWPGE